MKKKEYAFIGLFKPVVGFFKKKIGGQYLIFAWYSNQFNAVRFYQFYSKIKDDLYITGILGGLDSPIEEDLENIIENFRYHGQIEILEDNIPIKIVTGNTFKIVFNPPSKYLGKQLEFIDDSRLDRGFYMARCTVKKDFEPAIKYDVAQPISKNELITSVNKFTKLKLKNIIKTL